jgi:ribosomal protein S18 acetylase RimI-like enzyme
MTLTVRPFSFTDYPVWLRLWTANNAGQPDPAATKQTWERLCDPGAQVKGLGAWEDGAFVGLVHYILHPVTGHLHPACYMQDVFVDPAFRRRGVARALVEKVAALGKREKWARIYWLAERDNEAAQALYRNVGVVLDFTLHVLPL